MKLLDVVHPAAKTLVEIAKSQDAEVETVFYMYYQIHDILWSLQTGLMHCFMNEQSVQ